MEALAVWRSVHEIVRSRKDAKGVARQWCEMSALWALHGLGPNYYQVAGFWRRDQRWGRMTRHLSHERYQATVAKLNPPQYRKISQNKLSEKALLTLVGIPTPRFLGVLDAANGRDASGAPLRSAADLERLIAGDSAAGVCFKLVEGFGGRGFVAAGVERSPDGVRLRLKGARQGEPGMDAATLMAMFGPAPRIVEAYIDQHPSFAAFNPTSVNTLRIWVLKRGGRSSVRLAYLRMGRQGSLVDNHAAGGIVAAVDLASGRVAAARDGNSTYETFATHPDHGARIEGVVLHRFAEAAAAALECLHVLPAMNFAGMDVAMTTEGPVIIEANVVPSHDGAAYTDTPTRDVFELGPDHAPG